MKIKKPRWGSDFSYGIGLLASDGCLSSDRRHIEYCSKDLESVINFKKSFKINNKIGRKNRGTAPRREYYRIQFGDVAMYDILTRIGLSPRKSLTIGPLRIPNRYFSDFLRGVIDGDGCIDYFIHPESTKKQFRIRIASGSLRFIEWLRNELNALLNIRGAIRRVMRAYQLCYYKKASAKLSKYIYYKKNILCLSRKFKIAKLIK